LRSGNMSSALSAASPRFLTDYETRILPRAGGYGRYNRVAVAFSWFPAFAVTLNLFSDVFFTLIPDTYRCEPDPTLLPPAFLRSNLSRQDYLNLTVPWEDGSGLFGPVLLGLCELTRSPPLQWNLVCSNYWKIPLQHICFMTGWIVGYILLGTICDWLGRRRGFLLSVSLSALSGVAVCLSSSAVMFLLLRLCQGAVLAGVFLSAYIFRLELCDPPHRLMVAMVGGFFAVSAELLLPGVAVLCRDWPVLQAVATVPLLLLLPYWCCASLFPESPRWLLATDQIPRAKSSLREFAARNGACQQDEMYPGETLMSGTNTWSSLFMSHKSNWYLFLSHHPKLTKFYLKHRILYCFTRNLHLHSSNFYFTYFLRVITGALACVFICLSVNHFGRRGMLLLSAIITGLSSLLLLALTQCTFVLSADQSCPRGCLGLVLAAGCVGMAASSLMELQNNGGYFLHHVIFASFAVLSVLCIMLLPESKRKSLPDSLKEGESQRRPPLFLSRPDRDHLPLLCGLGSALLKAHHQL
uniref:Solute carrier family 22 member 31 n=1 Tax=Kryptolebias marmoratus TaxID=37003 RepID=A0A3Q2ZDZ0_KRYMA